MDVCCPDTQKHRPIVAGVMDIETSTRPLPPPPPPGGPTSSNPLSAPSVRDSPQLATFGAWDVFVSGYVLPTAPQNSQCFGRQRAACALCGPPLRCTGDDAIRPYRLTDITSFERPAPVPALWQQLRSRCTSCPGHPRPSPAQPCVPMSSAPTRPNWGLGGLLGASGACEPPVPEPLPEDSSLTMGQSAMTKD